MAVCCHTLQFTDCLLSLQIFSFLPFFCSSSIVIRSVFFLTMFIIGRRTTEYVFIFVRWIIAADIVHINIAHGFIC